MLYSTARSTVLPMNTGLNRLRDREKAFGRDHSLTPALIVMWPEKELVCRAENGFLRYLWNKDIRVTLPSHPMTRYD
jgi:hypothetical protein